MTLVGVDQKHRKISKQVMQKCDPLSTQITIILLHHKITLGHHPFLLGGHLEVIIALRIHMSDITHQLSVSHCAPYNNLVRTYTLIVSAISSFVY